MSTIRLQWWLVIGLTKLFGRKVEVENSNGRKIRVFPIVWGQKIHLLGIEKERVIIDFVSEYTLRVKRMPDLSLTRGTPIPSLQERPFSVVHAMLSHVVPRQTDQIID